MSGELIWLTGNGEALLEIPLISDYLRVERSGAEKKL